MLTTRSPVLFIFAVFLSLGICYVYYKSPTLQCGALSSMPRDVFQHHQERRRGEATAVDGEPQSTGASTDQVRQVAASTSLSARNDTEPPAVPLGKSRPKMKVKLSPQCRQTLTSIANDPPPKTFNEQLVVEKILKVRDCPWLENRTEIDAFRLTHANTTGGASQVVITRSNSPINTSIVFDQSRKTLVVDAKVTNLFLKEFPERSGRYPRCAVVGNGGILANSSCGSQIDAADFVIRCNIPPVGGNFQDDVGSKTDIVTSNPTIFINRFESLIGRRKEFIRKMSSYGASILLIPAFSVSAYTSLAYRAIFTLDDFESQQRVAFFNPSYMRAISRFWKKRGVKESHITSGLMMTSVAMDLCDEVHVYGFWPFVHDLPTPVQVKEDERRRKPKRSRKRKKGAQAAAAPTAAPVDPPQGRQLHHHYYDDQQPKKVHSMPSEFAELLRLHSRGVLRLHVNACGGQ
ncbi:alpha-N-acetylneuraminide alpha-2,8-sialyltransferase-like isoform X2 [Lethenteron reissneri]|uniref:alpha-N-acetylneuraminide alpha-2,8-sialyltransferase-like isoform X2 n=1 Tax=Lethenteron reissneri TaxID=7753 RepID=UPI002AB5F1E0|nr:alpha-N-acetylneuraminide alpha-2,8-sialyltransferase-like isoform X2 [Lethenteron reissneri]